VLCAARSLSLLAGGNLNNHFNTRRLGIFSSQQATMEGGRREKKMLF
jgi:hypothetical protein